MSSLVSLGYGLIDRTVAIAANPFSYRRSDFLLTQNENGPNGPDGPERGGTRPLAGPLGGPWSKLGPSLDSKVDGNNACLDVCFPPGSGHRWSQL